MNKLSLSERVQVINALVEGNSINSTVRMTGIGKPTILRLIVSLGKACADFHEKNVRNVKAKRIQCDEIWAFVYAKAKNVPDSLKAPIGAGDVWTWTAIDSDSKLIVSYLVGGRDAGYATDFMHDLAGRLANRVQLTTDGHKVYMDAVDDAFAGDVDYAQLVKIYGAERPGEARYSPANWVGSKKEEVCGAPDPRDISTSHVERQNLTMRMGMRRFTRLTNAFSKKIENHAHMTAIFFCFYNWCRIHQTLKVIPAMAAGLTTKLWEIEDLIGLLEK